MARGIPEAGCQRPEGGWRGASALAMLRWDESAPQEVRSRPIGGGCFVRGFIFPFSPPFARSLIAWASMRFKSPERGMTKVQSPKSKRKRRTLNAERRRNGSRRQKKMEDMEVEEFVSRLQRLDFIRDF